MHPHQLTKIEDIKTFMFAGNATFTLVSKRTGARFTFKMNTPKKKENPHFVSLMNGPDNEANYMFMGTIFDKGEYRPGRNSKISTDAPSARAFTWFYGAVTQNVMPDNVEFWHEGKCCRCGRKLTVPESIENGIGPECIKKVHKH